MMRSLRGTETAQLKSPQTALLIPLLLRRSLLRVKMITSRANEEIRDRLRKCKDETSYRV